MRHASDQESVDSVNPHYLNQVIAVSNQHGVLASEDIVASNGMKLLVKGARVDTAVRDRLLQHKLQMPLEDCAQIVDGVVAERFGPIADRLLEGHPLLRSLCTGGSGQSVQASLVKLRLSVPMQSLLTVYCEQQEDRLAHAVGVAMIALALARRLLPGEVDRHRTLGMAGLVHDVGELYIDPTYLRRDARLGPQEWKHIVAHPLVGHRVLRNMEGAGASVAEAVLTHHERLDGFGYPRAIAGSTFALDGQILAAAEWLMALMASGRVPQVCASVATRLIPGEFSPIILDELATVENTIRHDQCDVVKDGDATEANP